LILEGERPGSPYYEACLDAAMDATRKYYRTLEKLDKIRKEAR
jgi:hypothetical protein